MMPGTMSPPPKSPGSKWPIFLVNRSGLPFDELTWNELWEFAAFLYPEAKTSFRNIQSAETLEELPTPHPPSLSMAKQGRILEYLSKVQDYMNRLSYNHTGTQFFETRPNSSLHTLVEAAKVIVREALPIKCMEAVVLAIYLSNGVPGLGRFTINFKSELPPLHKLSSHAHLHASPSAKRYFYHVVLGVVLGNRFGSLGLSRRTNLMNKPVQFSSLFDLMEEFEKSYQECGQRLVKIRIGRLISHDQYSISPIPWKGITIHLQTEDPKVMKCKVEKHSKELRSALRGAR